MALNHDLTGEKTKKVEARHSKASTNVPGTQTLDTHPDAESHSKAPLTKRPKQPSNKPTVFQLALLAEIVTLRPGYSGGPDAAVQEAMNFWQTATKASVAKGQLVELIRGVFDCEREEWETRIEAYAGDKLYLQQVLNGENSDAPRWDVQSEILPKLFTAKNETEASRHEKLGLLLQFAADRGKNTQLLLPHDLGRRPTRRPLPLEGKLLNASPLITAESLLGRKLTIRQVRFIVEARLHQLSESKVRPKRTEAKKT